MTVDGGSILNCRSGIGRRDESDTNIDSNPNFKKRIKQEPTTIKPLDLTVSCRNHLQVLRSSMIHARSQWCVSAIRKQRTAHKEVRFDSILPQSAASCRIKHNMHHKSVVCQCNQTSKLHTRSQIWQYLAAVSSVSQDQAQYAPQVSGVSARSRTSEPHTGKLDWTVSCHSQRRVAGLSRSQQQSNHPYSKFEHLVSANKSTVHNNPNNTKMRRHVSGDTSRLMRLPEFFQFS